MRIASLVVSWICWLIAAAYWLYLMLVSFYPSLLPTTDPKQPTDRLFLYSGIVIIMFGYLLWYIRKCIWFDSARTIGPGFFIYLFPLYFTALCAVIGPYMDHIIMGHRNLFFKTGFILTLPLLVLVFPRLPKAKSSE